MRITVAFLLKKCSTEPRHGVVFVLSVSLQTIKFDEIQCFWKWKTPFDFLCTKYTNWKQPIKVVPGISVFNMSHFAYACKMRYPLNLVLENSEYLWFYWTFYIIILDYGLKLHKLSNHTLVMLQKWLEIH